MSGRAENGLSLRQGGESPHPPSLLTARLGWIFPERDGRKSPPLLEVELPMHPREMIEEPEPRGLAERGRTAGHRTMNHDRKHTRKYARGQA